MFPSSKNNTSQRVFVDDAEIRNKVKSEPWATNDIKCKFHS